MYTRQDGLVRYRDDVYSSNGLTWDTHNNKFYYIDSCKFDIKEYDWDPSTGRIYNEKIAYDFRINGEFTGYTADGMTINRNGLLWVGLFKGNSIVAIDPVCHKVVKNITIPAHQVTAAVFGGPNLDEIFVTTAGRPFDIQIGERDSVPEPPLSGYLFQITGLKSRGYAPYELRCI
ncbi:putative sugar lactone lactonase YvrE [Sitodiplosis mosellana]|uniref:putative sugar lactone lactonase YvrE n=1 Tax=Sitodiplosis mosellana TaxID=263140 RepID=UPI0024451C0F|nr:putative sugar lactone lactonase YvrE [Sitodiplosis mosellana]